MSEFERIVEVEGAYDHLGKGGGIGACRIRFILKGPLGAVQFMVGTNWYMPSAQAHLKRVRGANGWSERDFAMQPDGWDVGCHSPKPMYEGQPSRDDCNLLPGGTCYYDGSGLQADEWVPDFVAGGTDWLWPRLETEYRERFAPPPTTE